MSMTCEVNCPNPECDEMIEVEFDYERAEQATRIDPGYPARAAICNIVSLTCDCEDRDEDIIEEDCLTWLEDQRP